MIIDYIMLGLIVNFISIFVNIILLTILMLSMNFSTADALNLRNRLYDYASKSENRFFESLGFIIPFYKLYKLIILVIILLKNTNRYNKVDYIYNSFVETDSYTPRFKK